MGAWELVETCLLWYHPVPQKAVRGKRRQAPSKMLLTPAVARDAAIVVCGHAMLPTLVAFVVLPIALSVSTQGADDVSQRLLEAFAVSLGVRVAMQLFSTAIEMCGLFVVCLCASEGCKQWNQRVGSWLSKVVSRSTKLDKTQAISNQAPDLRRWLDLQRVKRE